MHKLNELFDRGKEKKACDSGCPNYRFDHLECACVLSSVYSVNKGEMCAIYVEELEKTKSREIK